MNHKANLKMLAKVPDDEPVFILRARDCLALTTLTYWLSNADTVGIDWEKLESVRETLQQFADWQKKNKTRLPGKVYK